MSTRGLPENVRVAIDEAVERIVAAMLPPKDWQISVIAPLLGPDPPAHRRDVA